ncbi:MAG: signal peptidase I [Gordonia sp. (in: high G+C Gram-positive bacteria)]|uniref:signal peptidase I n=1 Tax=Gordonia TaxID=2053 RepID=UPI003266E48A
MNQQETGRTQQHRRRELALNIGAIAGLICIVIAALSMLFGIKPLVFRSGSMSPQISTGALALARTVPASEIEVGDVVSVDNEVGTRITHRVVAVDPAGDGKVSLTLKGDANRVADPSPYVVDEADRVFASVPLLGYLAAWFSSKTAIFLGGILAGALLMLAFGPMRRPGSDASDDAPQTDTTDEPADSSEAKLQEAHRG